MNNFRIILFLSVAVCGCTVEGEGGKKMLPKNETMETHCIGHHVIELPNSFSAISVTTGSFKQMGLDAQDPSIEVIVRTTELAPSKFAAEVAKRRAELKSSSSETVNVLRLEKVLDDDATIFRIQRIKDAYTSEIYLRRGSSIVGLRLKSYRGEFLAAEDRLVKFAMSTKAVESTKNSVQPQGFCLGPVIITGEFKDEKGSFLFRDGKGNDFDVEIDTYSIDGGGALLARMSDPNSLLSKFDIRHTVLRSGERTVAGMRAQEWLGWTNLSERGAGKTFGFTLETTRRTPGKKTPSLHLSFDTARALDDGSPTKTEISDNEAIHLWDSVVNSIRLAKP